MDKIIINGGRVLKGTSGLKAQKMQCCLYLAAALLASEGVNVIRDVPNLSDVGTINEVLKSLNANVDWCQKEMKSSLIHQGHCQRGTI